MMVVQRDWFSRDCEGGAVFEGPAVFQRVADDSEQLPGGGDDRLAGAAAFLDAAVEVIEIAGVADCDQRALNEGGPHQLVTALRNPPPVVCFVRLTDPGHDAETGGQLVGVLDVVDVADSGQEDRGRTPTDALDADQAVIAVHGLGGALDLPVQFGDRLGQAQGLVAHHLGLDLLEGGETAGLQSIEPPLRAEAFPRQLDPVARMKRMDLVQEPGALLDQQVAGVGQRGTFTLAHRLHPRLGQHVPGQKEGERPGVVPVGLLDRLADHPELLRVDDDHPSDAGNSSRNQAEFPVASTAVSSSASRPRQNRCRSAAAN